MKKDQRFIQGKFLLKNKDRYKGKLPVIYRSSLELNVFRWIDNNPNVEAWGVESVIIPYISPIDKRVHRYFVDLYVILREDKEFKKYLLEIKPYKQTLRPTLSGRKKQSTILYENATYAINQAKWKAAEAWCSTRDFQFVILTEKHIKVR
jgi:hypothetical protein